VRKGELTRQAILDVAVRQARYSGLSGLTIGSLAAAADMSKSGLYAHFKSKEALQLACMERNGEQFIDEVIRPALAKPRGITRLQAIVEYWMQWYSHPGGCLFLAAAAEFDDLPGPLHDFMATEQRKLIDSLARIAATAVDQGEFREDNWASRILSFPDAADRAWTAFNRLTDSLQS
jgi:AcrR family transcriptional regulator